VRGIEEEIKTDNSKNIFRIIRIARNWDVPKLAKALRVTPAYINAIEKGKIPSSRIVKDYATILDFNEDTIIKFMEKSNNDRFEEFLLKILKIICDKKNNGL